jgi:hypothetical protein
MPTRTDELLAHLDRARSTLRAAFDAVPPERRETAPAPDRWSPAQVLEHLAIVDTQIATLLRRGVRTATATGPLPPAADQRPVLSTVDEARLLDRERRLDAPPHARPTGNDAVAAWRALDEAHAALRDLLQATDGRDASAVRARHPFLGELDFHQWLAFVGFHALRHAAQIRAAAAGA